MLKRSLLLLLFWTCWQPMMAQPDTTPHQAPPPAPGSHLRVSLITCGPGDNEVWEVFGHTAIRVIDSATHLDLAYNYGTFEFGPNFELQFMRGKLLYCLSVYDFASFMPEYVIAKRSVEEQELLLSDKQKQDIYSFLNWNARPENKYYKYDFFFDNCATRIRDVFPKSFGGDFTFGRAVPPGSKLTFRDIMNRYFYRDHWTRMGVNILLGSRIDKVMSNTDIMFLPDYLRDGVGGATVGGMKIAEPPRLLLAGGPVQSAGINWPFVVMCLVALLTILGLCVPRLRLLGRFMSATLLAVTGLLGCLILLMWFGTDHQGCSDNFNVLWCLPTNLLVVFFNQKGKGRYAIIAIILLLVSVVLHLMRIQGITLLELSPLFLAMVFVYGMIYKKSISKAISNA